MSDEKTSLLRKLWRGVDLARRVVVNLIFIAIVIGVIVLAVRDGSPDVPDTAALVLAPQGRIVEQLGGDPVQRAMDELTGSGEAQTLFRDLLDAIEAAKDDERIAALYLDLDHMGGAGLAILQDLKAAVEDFKTSGKKVIASADFYTQGRYYLAALADEIYLHQEGLLVIEGFGRYRTYYRDIIDRLEIDWNVFRVGEYKSAVEPYLRNDMSPEARESNLEWLGDLWQIYLADVSAARGIPVEALEDYVTRLTERLEEANGDPADAALAAGLIDHAGGRDAVRDRLIELVGEDEDSHSYHRIGYQAYLESLGDDRPGPRSDGEGVGVIVARGTILDGSQPPGKIGGDSTAALIRKARHNDDVKALVLRVDSGGGSGFASEVIRRELELLREAGKPVVVSMASVAASGGYMISLPADEVWAYPTTITGSIGVYGMFPTFEKPLAKYLGIRVDGVGTTWLAGAARPDRALAPGLKQALQMITDQSYREFIALVAEARDTTPEAIDEIARGRVWSGQDALEVGLVDRLGTFDDAVAAAARLADLGDDHAVTFIEKELDFKDRIVVRLLSGAAAALGPGVSRAARPPAHLQVLRSLERELEQLAELNDPRGIYALCLCRVE